MFLRFCSAWDRLDYLLRRVATTADLLTRLVGIGLLLRHFLAP